MHHETSSHDTSCPLCASVMEQGSSLVWSDFCQRSICSRCALRLPMELHDRESTLFAAAARLLGVDIWECRKLYLADSIAKTQEQLDHEVERAVIGFLKTGMLRCTARIEAIDRYLDLCRGGAAADVLGEEERKLEEMLFGEQR